MAEDRQPPNVTEGAATAAVNDADLEDDITAQAKSKSAEDRKAAVALAALDDATRADSGASSNNKHVDSEAVTKAMKNLRLGASGTAAKKVKVDAADVALLVDELDLSKTKATDLLKQHEGDAVKAMRAYVSVA